MLASVNLTYVGKRVDGSDEIRGSIPLFPTQPNQLTAAMPFFYFLMQM